MKSKFSFWSLVFLVILIIDLVVPDPVPFVDEIVLAYLTLNPDASLIRKVFGGK